MIDRTRMSAALTLGLSATLSACTPGPRLAASWYLVYDPAAVVPYPDADPNPANPDGPKLPSAPTVALATGDTAPPVGEIYILLRNLGGKVELGKVLLGADGPPLEPAGRAGQRIVLRPGEVVVLPLQNSTKSSRSCLIPTMLRIEALSPRRTSRMVKVAGGPPTSLPDEWIRYCDGSGLGIPPAAGIGGGPATPSSGGTASPG